MAKTGERGSGSLNEAPGDEDGVKAAFAVELLKNPAEPFKAALAIFPTNTNKALRISNEWPSDPFVIDEVKRLRAEGVELQFLPSKADVARSLWERAHAATTEDRDFEKIVRLYTEVMDFVPKASKIDANAKNASSISVSILPQDEQL